MHKCVSYLIFLFFFYFKAAMADENICADIPNSLAQITHGKIDSHNQIDYSITTPHKIEKHILDRVLLSRNINDKTLIETELMHREIEDGSYEETGFSITPMKDSKISIEIIYADDNCVRTMHIEIK